MKCECVCWHPSAGVLEARELADPGCPNCAGTGNVPSRRKVINCAAQEILEYLSPGGYGWEDKRRVFNILNKYFK